MPAKGDANSRTTSAVAPGTIDIRKNPTQDISALSRNTNNALNELGRIFDKQKIEEQQELAKAFGEEAFRLAHNLPDDGSGRKIAVLYQDYGQYSGIDLGKVTLVNGGAFVFSSIVDGSLIGSAGLTIGATILANIVIATGANTIKRNWAQTDEDKEMETP